MKSFYSLISVEFITKYKVTGPTHAKLLWCGCGVAEDEELLSTEPEPEPWKSPAPISDLISASSVSSSVLFPASVIEKMLEATEDGVVTPSRVLK